MTAGIVDRGKEVLADLRPTLALAGPVVLAELGWMGMGVVDTMIVGGLGAEAIGAVSLGSVAFFTPAVFGMGLLLGLDTMVSQAEGAGDHQGARRSLAQGLILAGALAVPLMLLARAIGPALAVLGVNPTVHRLALPYLDATAWGSLPLLVYAAARRYLQAVHRVGVVMFALLSANVVNALADWALVYGKLGIPAMGVVGAGWATTISRSYMALVLLVSALREAKERAGPAPADLWRLDVARLRRLVGLGLPAATQVTLEVGVFAMATALAGKLAPAALAAHQIVLNLSSVTFMVPLGLASAGAVRVGQAIGGGKPSAAACAGWATLALGTGFMAVAAAAFVLFPRILIGGFTRDPGVLALGVPLLHVAAGFQLFDGVQGVTTGNLRGAGDTRSPMICHALAHWGIGLPIGYALAFPAGLGAMGLWLGLSAGLAVAGVVLLRVWWLRSQEMRRSVR